MGKQWKQWQTLFSWAPKSLQMVTAAMKFKRCLLLGRKAVTSLDNILKSRDVADKGPSSDSSAFSKTSLNIWKFTVHVFLKLDLENFEHYITSMWENSRNEHYPQYSRREARLYEWFLLDYNSGDCLPCFSFLGIFHVIDHNYIIIIIKLFPYSPLQNM